MGGNHALALLPDAGHILPIEAPAVIAETAHRLADTTIGPAP